MKKPLEVPPPLPEETAGRQPVPTSLRLCNPTSAPGCHRQRRRKVSKAGKTNVAQEKSFQRQEVQAKPLSWCRCLVGLHSILASNALEPVCF